MMQTSLRLRVIFALAIAAMTVACGGTNTPFGPVVGSRGGGDPPPPRLVDIRFSVTLPARTGLRPNYLSPKTASLTIQLVEVNGKDVTVYATTMNTVPKAPGCKDQGNELVCTATISGSPGTDLFAVSTYSDVDATGKLLSAGTAQTKVAAHDGFGISNKLSLSIDGVIASLKLSVTPNSGDRGKRVTAGVTLDAYDASGQEIVGPSDYYDPIALTIQGDSGKAFRLHDGDHSGTSLTIVKPTAGITLSYDGNRQASPVTLQASVNGPGSVTASAPFKLGGKQPPPPVGIIYALNLGKKDGQGATVTEYDGKAKGNVAPATTLDLDAKLYARTIAVDSSGNLYVGYLDNDLGYSLATGEPDTGNEIAIYAKGASGNATPEAVLTSDGSTAALFPIFITFDPSNRLVTYGSTDVDKNAGDAVLTYAAGSSGKAAPEYGWQFDTPQIRYAGPTGLALDSSGNFYVNGALHTELGPNDGLYINSAANIGNPESPPARYFPWDDTTGLESGFTTNDVLNGSGEIFIGNAVSAGSGSKTSCQARASVFAAGASGGETDKKPLRVLTFDGIGTNNPQCTSSNNTLVSYFPAIAIYGTSLFAADDFNNAVDEFASDGNGTVKPMIEISGSATQLDAPIALVITKASGLAKARPAFPAHAHPAQ